VKLTDLIYGASGVVRDATNFVRYPTQIVRQHLSRIAQEKFENLELPLHQGNQAPEEVIKGNGNNGHAPARQGVIEREAAHKVLAQSPAQDLPDPAAEILPNLEGKEVKGHRGRYKVERLLSEDEPVYWYRGRSLSSNMSVMVKEYRLTELSPKEIEQVQDNLDNVAPVSLKSGGVQDFRLINPWDMWVNVAEKRGYLIIRDLLEQRLTLRQYLKRTGKMPPRQVRRVLEQVLQSLWFLHNHKIRFADGKVESGLGHGNLSLDSLSIVPDPPRDRSPTDDPQFHIYLSDLALWENAFQPHQSDPSFTDLGGQTELVPFDEMLDLQALGHVGQALLWGEASAANQSLNSPQWAAIADPPLKHLIGQLLDQDIGSAEAAYKAVLALPEPGPEPEALASAPNPDANAAQGHPIGCIKLLLLMSFLAFGGWWSWRWLASSGSQPSPIASLLPASPQPPSAILDITSLPPKRPVKYAVSSLWEEAMGQRRVAQTQNFQAELKQRDDRFKNFLAISVSESNYQKALAAREIDFVLSAKNDTWDNTKFNQTIVAYDGLVVFVAASDPQRQGNVPRELQGKMSFERLRQIYGGEDQGFTPYKPNNQMEWELFWQVVLQHDPDKIQKFKQVTEKTQLSKNSQFEKIFQDFENNPGQKKGIGFARLSKVFGQCSVYPLAIGEAGQEKQALIQADRQPIQPAQIDLCNAKGSYWADPEAFRNKAYPLIYELAVIYPTDNPAPAEAFIAALKTDEGQCLLSETGLVPIEPVRQRGICDGSSN
jgi:hypothetical protein